MLTGTQRHIKIESGSRIKNYDFYLYIWENWELMIKASYSWRKIKKVDLGREEGCSLVG